MLCAVGLVGPQRRRRLILPSPPPPPKTLFGAFCAIGFKRRISCDNSKSCKTQHAESVARLMVRRIQSSSYNYNNINLLVQPFWPGYIELPHTFRIYGESIYICIYMVQLALNECFSLYYVHVQHVHFVLLLLLLLLLLLFYGSLYMCVVICWRFARGLTI